MRAKSSDWSLVCQPNYVQAKFVRTAANPHFGPALTSRWISGEPGTSSWPSSPQSSGILIVREIPERSQTRPVWDCQSVLPPQSLTPPPNTHHPEIGREFLGSSGLPVPLVHHSSCLGMDTHLSASPTASRIGSDTHLFLHRPRDETSPHPPSLTSLSGPGKGQEDRKKRTDQDRQEPLRGSIEKAPERGDSRCPSTTPE